MATGRPLIQVDAFAAEPFVGNPAAVCLLSTEPTEAWMQAVAAEMNLAETAFVLPRGDCEFSIRWFTPTVEVPLCGHATLASAHAMWEEGIVPAGQPIVFHAQTGRLDAAREGDWIRLDFPALPTEECPPPAGLAEALGCQPLSVHRNNINIALAELDSGATVRGLQPDFARLCEVPIDACIVTARDDTGQFDFVSRFFGPKIGIDEDPVTGAAHCSLGPFWSQRLNKSEMTAFQASPRGGVVRVRLHDDRVDLLGQAVTIFRGKLLH